jgi:hypothetical protein
MVLKMLKFINTLNLNSNTYNVVNNLLNPKRHKSNMSFQSVDKVNTLLFFKKV